jgi:hypothetical protein
MEPVEERMLVEVRDFAAKFMPDAPHCEMVTAGALYSAITKREIGSIRMVLIRARKAEREAAEGSGKGRELGAVQDAKDEEVLMSLDHQVIFRACGGARRSTASTPKARAGSQGGLPTGSRS